MWLFWQLEQSFMDQKKHEEMQRVEEEKRREKDRQEEKKKREQDRILEVSYYPNILIPYFKFL